MSSRTKTGRVCDIGSATRAIALTGGLATGKSSIASLFAERGAFVFSADEAQRAVLGPGMPCRAAVAHRFGEAALPDGGLDRRALADIVFADPDRRRELEELLHPPIMLLLESQVRAVREDFPYGALVVVEVPLLYEAGLQDRFDAVLVVALDPEEQLCRAVRRGSSLEDARARIASQMPIRRKAEHADWAIWNGRPLDEAGRRVDEIVRHLALLDGHPGGGP